MICEFCGVRYKKDPIFEECPACGGIIRTIYADERYSIGLWTISSLSLTIGR